jgi:hypothetical protein
VAAVEVVVEEAAVGAVGLVAAAEVAEVAAAGPPSETIAEGLAMKMKIFRKMKRLTPKNSRTELRTRTEKRSLLWTMLRPTRREARA